MILCPRHLHLQFSLFLFQPFHNISFPINTTHHCTSMNMEPNSPSSPSPSDCDASRIPKRRRAIQACTNCRARKTRCDAAEPKCSLCLAQNVECEYRDSQQLRIEPNTRLILQRIQLLEQRLLSSPPGLVSGISTQSFMPTSNQQQSTLLPERATMPQAFEGETGGRPSGPVGSSPRVRADESAPATLGEMTYPLSHTASANHVLGWPIVQQLLHSAQAETGSQPGTATDVFFGNDFITDKMWNDYPAATWRLYGDQSIDELCQTVEFRSLVRWYFDKVNVFFPLLSFDHVIEHLEFITQAETHDHDGRDLSSSYIPPSQYCLVLLVLCLGSFARRGGSIVRLSDHRRRSPYSQGPENETPYAVSSLDQLLWRKAKLLLGHISSNVTIQAAQCAMLAR